MTSSCSFQVNTLRTRQNGRHFADDIFKCIFLNEHVWIPIKISTKVVPMGPINIIPALVQIMAWRRPGDKPLSEPMVVSLTTHMCVTRPQWVKLKSRKVPFVRSNRPIVLQLCTENYNEFGQTSYIAHPTLELVQGAFQTHIWARKSKSS